MSESTTAVSADETVSDSQKVNQRVRESLRHFETAIAEFVANAGNTCVEDGAQYRVRMENNQFVVEKRYDEDGEWVPVLNADQQDSS